MWSGNVHFKIRENYRNIYVVYGRCDVLKPWLLCFNGIGQESLTKMVQNIEEKSDNGMAKMSVTGKNGVIPNLNVEKEF